MAIHLETLEVENDKEKQKVTEEKRRVMATLFQAAIHYSELLQFENCFTNI